MILYPTLAISMSMSSIFYICSISTCVSHGSLCCTCLHCMKRFPETLCPCKYPLCLANILFYTCKYRVCSVRVSRRPAADWVRPLEASGHTAGLCSWHQWRQTRRYLTHINTMHVRVVLVDICVRLAPGFKNLKPNWKCYWWQNSKSNVHVGWRATATYPDHCITRCSLWCSRKLSENEDENRPTCITLTFVLVLETEF